MIYFALYKINQKGVKRPIDDSLDTAAEAKELAESMGPGTYELAVAHVSERRAVSNKRSFYSRFTVAGFPA